MPDRLVTWLKGAQGGILLWRAPEGEGDRLFGGEKTGRNWPLRKHQNYLLQHTLL